MNHSRVTYKRLLYTKSKSRESIDLTDELRRNANDSGGLLLNACRISVRSRTLEKKTNNLL